MLAACIHYFMNMKTFSQLKECSRGLLMGKYRTVISALLITQLIVNTLSFLTGVSTVDFTLIGLIIHLPIGFILSLLYGVLNIGNYALYLNISCQRPYHFSDIFIGFKTHPNQSIGLQFFYLLLTRFPLYLILGSLFLFLFFLDLQYPILDLRELIASEDLTLVLILFFFLSLFLIGFLLFFFWISLGLSQSFFLLLDFPQYSIKQLLRMSWKLMKGHKRRLFLLQLSFLPLVIIGYLSLGTGLVFVIPYQKMAYTQFYLNLIQCKASADGKFNPISLPQYIDYQV